LCAAPEIVEALAGLQPEEVVAWATFRRNESIRSR
jgi:hypothetical protein